MSVLTNGTKRRKAVERSRQIAGMLTAHGLGSLLENAGLQKYAPALRRRGFVHETPTSRAEHLREALTDLGGTFVKLGQMLSTRADLLPPDYIEELSKLQDSVPPVPYSEIHRVFGEEFNCAPESVFSSVERVPIASASIGQVHAATLQNGTEVVIKVRRPGIAETVDSDLEVLRGVVKWAREHTAFARDYDLDSLVDEFAYTLRNELDYRREATNCDRFRHNFSGDPAIVVPWVFWDFTSERVLTMERVSGIKITDLDAIDQAGIPRRTIADNAVRLFLREVLEFGFFHADPHPGNFFVRPDGSLAVVDYGMVGQLSARLREHLLRAGLAASRMDAEGVAEELYAIGVAGRKATSHGRFLRDLDHALGRYAGTSVAEISMARVTEELTAMAYRHKLQLPHELALVSRVIAMSEGLGLRVDPEFRFLEAVRPLVRDYWKRTHSPGATLQKMGEAAADTVDFGVQLPHRLRRIMGRIERGQIELHVNHEGLETMAREFQIIVNRLAVSVILGSLIVGMGLVLTFYRPTVWVRFGNVLFTLTFLFTIVFGAMLAISIWRSRRRRF